MWSTIGQIFAKTDRFYTLPYRKACIIRACTVPSRAWGNRLSDLRHARHGILRSGYLYGEYGKKR